MENLLDMFDKLQIDNQTRLNLEQLMINDIYSIQTCYENMNKGFDFELNISDDPDYQYLDRNTLGDFIKTNYYGIISKNIHVADMRLLDSIVDYYLDQNHCSD